LASNVHLPGFKEYDELPVYYGLAGAFVHASMTEQWGVGCERSNRVRTTGDCIETVRMRAGTSPRQ
jgi:hypothetical protein